MNKLTILLFIEFIVLACSGNKEEQRDSSDSIKSPSDTVYAGENTAIVESAVEGTFSGEYLIGDGNTYIVPVGDTYEMQDGTGNASNVLYFQGKENDTLSVYSTQDKSITFKMNPGYKYGMYYAPNEQLPVELVGPIPEQ